MFTATATDTTSSSHTAAVRPTTQELERRIERMHARKNFKGMRETALQAARTLAQTEAHVKQLAKIHAGLREKFDALTAPEHYCVTITGVYRGERLTVEVAGLGNTRCHVAVDSDIDPNKLQVGARALVSHDRTCLLKVIANTGPWQRVATFERLLEPSGRILVNDRETLLAVDLAGELDPATLKKGDLIGFDPEVSGIAYQRIDPPPREHLFDENVSDDFADLGGLDAQIAKLKVHLDFRFRHPELAAKYALASKCGILLEGLPGNGKTRLARCCAGYVRSLFPNRPCRFMHVAGSSDYSMWFGESERKLIERFAAVREAAKEGLVVMFFDEVDAIATRRGTDYGSGAADRILSTLLSQLDGVVALTNVMILFATNRADTLDPAFLRPGRIHAKIEIPPPNRRAAEAILHRYLGCGLSLAGSNRSVDELISPLLSRVFAANGELAKLAEVKLSDGRRIPIAGRQLLSGAMLENVVKTAAQQAACRDAELGQEGVRGEDLRQALDSELMAAVSTLAPGNVKSFVRSIPQDAQPIAIERMDVLPLSTYVRSTDV